MEHHKSECVNATKLYSPSLTDVKINEMLQKMIRMEKRLRAIGDMDSVIDSLKRTLAFTRHHIGNHASGISRGLVKVDNYIMCQTLTSLAEAYNDKSSSFERGNDIISYASEARQLLLKRVDQGLDDAWVLLTRCDRYLRSVYTERGQLDKAEYHSAQSLVAARRYRGTDQISVLIWALMSLSRTYLLQETRLQEALGFAEEAYVIASKDLSPVHTTVQQAATQIVQCLIHMQDFAKAETYCRNNYENLIDPLHAAEYCDNDASHVLIQLAEIWLHKEPDENETIAIAQAAEAEESSRKAFNIFHKKYRHITVNYVEGTRIFGEVLLKRNRLTEETEGILQQYVLHASADKEVKPDRYSHALNLLGEFYKTLSETLPVGELRNKTYNKSAYCMLKKLVIDAFLSGIEIEEKNDSGKIASYFTKNKDLYI